MEPTLSGTGPGLAGSRHCDELALFSDTLSSTRLSTPLHHSEGKQIVEPTLSLADFPTELLIMIFKAFLLSYGGDWQNGYGKEETRAADERFHRFDIWRDMVNFAATCKKIHKCVTPIIYGLDNCAYGTYHSSALLLSAKKGNVAGILKCLEFGARVDATDWTELRILDEAKTTRRSAPLRLASLHWASYHRHLDAMDVLLQRGANPNDVVPVETFWPDTRLRSPASNEMGSVYRSHTRLISLGSQGVSDLFDEGANALYLALLSYAKHSYHHLDQESDQEYQARKNAGIDAARLLIRAGASLITHTGLGLHALHQTSCDHDLEIVRFLLEEVGVDPNVRDPLGNTPMHYSALSVPESNMRPLIGLLLRHGAYINAENAAGYTPLHSFLRAAAGRFVIDTDTDDACFAFLEAGAYAISSEPLLAKYLPKEFEYRLRPLCEERKQIILDAQRKGVRIYWSRVDKQDAETDETASDFDEEDSDVDENEMVLSEEESKAVNIQLCKLWCKKVGEPAPEEDIGSWSLDEWEEYRYEAVKE